MSGRSHTGGTTPAIQSAEARCRDEPDSRDHWLALTDLLGAAGDWSAVVDACHRSIAVFDDWAEPWFRLSVAAEELGDLAESYRAAEAAVRRDQNHVRAQAQLGLRRVELGERLDGMERLLTTSQMTADPFVVLRRAKAHIYAAQADSAEYWARRLLDSGTAPDQARLLLAKVYEMTGRLDEAAAMLAEVAVPTAVSVFLDATIRRRMGDSLGALAVLDAAEPPARSLDPAMAAVERGRSLEQLGRYHDAWAEFTASNAIARSRSLYGTEMLDWFRQAGEWWQTPAAGPPRGASTPAARTPVAFVVGFPRSGTTLVEQILTSGTGLVSTAECSAMATANAELAAVTRRSFPELLDHLDEAAVGTLRKAYWEVLARWLVPDGVPVLDKLPLNLLYLASIEAAFPATKVVMVRRNPRDVVLSAYQQSFEDNPAMALTTRLDTTAEFFSVAMELWSAARSRLTVPTLELRYEDLVATPEPSLARLGDFLGLELSVPTSGSTGRIIHTPSYATAAGPINDRGVGRWRRYEKHLDPVLPRLAPWIAAHEALGG